MSDSCGTGRDGWINTRAGPPASRGVGTHGRHESLDQFRRVRNQVVKVFIDLEDGHDGVLPDVAVAVFLPSCIGGGPLDVDTVILGELEVLTRQERHVGINGSSSSGSRIFWRKRRVAPRMYSFGCCCGARHISTGKRGMMLKLLESSRGHFGWRCCKPDRASVSKRGRVDI